MALTKLIIFALLGYVVSAASISTPNQGYLQADLNNARVKCSNAPANSACPSLQHQIPVVDAHPDLFYLTSVRVNMTLNTVKFLNDSTNCTDDVREYACSNSVMQCTPNSMALHGVNLQFDVSRAKKACGNAQKSCTNETQKLTIYDCSAIQTNPMSHGICKKHKPTTNVTCRQSKYTHPVPFTELYPKRLEGYLFMKQHLAAMNIVPYRDDACEKAFTDVYCQILQGPICSVDMTKRMYAISQQYCDQVAEKCLIPRIKTSFKDICKLLPDKTAKQVSLPPSSTSDSNSSGSSNKVGSSGSNTVG